MVAIKQYMDVLDVCVYFKRRGTVIAKLAVRLYFPEAFE